MGMHPRCFFVSYLYKLSDGGHGYGHDCVEFTGPTSPDTCKKITAAIAGKVGAKVVILGLTKLESSEGLNPL